MSLLIVEQPESGRRKSCKNLSIGTWFIGETSQLFVVALDDRTHEARAVCLSPGYPPMVSGIPLNLFSARVVLNSGTLLQIVPSATEGGQHV